MSEAGTDGMNVAQYVRLAIRESRRSGTRIGLFITCIAIGVAAVVLVAGLSRSVTDGVRTEGRRLLAADVSVDARRPIPPELDGLLAEFSREHLRTADKTIVRTHVREFVSVVVAPERPAMSLLAELKVVEKGYPFYGRLKLDPDRPVQDLLSADSVVVAPELLSRLELKTGDSLRIGGADFRVAGAVVEEPDKLTISFTLGPRVFLSPEALARTALLDRGARVEYRALLKLPDQATASDATRLKRFLANRLPDAEFFNVRMFTEAQPSLRRGFERIDRYLGLVGLLSLLVGGIGVAQVARVWLASRMNDIAILRCLGLKPRQIVILFMAQVIVLALLGGITGAALGTGLHWLLPRLLSGLLPLDLIQPWQPEAVARGVLLGLFVAVIFTFPLLLSLRNVPPVRVLRRDAEPVGPSRLLQVISGVVIIGGVWAAASLQSESFKHGSIFTGGLIGAVLLLALAAGAASRLVRLLPRDAGGVRLRHALAHLGRPGASTVGAIVALGLGVTFVFATRLVERHLGEQLQAELPETAPSTFLVDVQPDQWPALKTMLEQDGAANIDSQPIVTARFSSIDGIPVSELVNRNRPAPTATAAPEGGPRAAPRRWTLSREQRLTYGDSLPRGNVVTAGRFVDPAVRNGVSIEQEFARDLGVGLGSKITLDVQGVPIDLVVTSLRKIDWRTFGINFFMFASSGPLDGAPQQRVAVARIDREKTAALQAKIVEAFPNITVIQIRDVMEKVATVLNNLALAVRSLGAFVIVAGTIVLGGSIAAQQARRSREIALLKAVGMTRRDVIAMLSIEYALMGLIAAIIGITAGSLLAWGVLSEVMELPWSMELREVVIAIGLTIVLAILAGLIASARALSIRPIEALRSD